MTVEKNEIFKSRMFARQQLIDGWDQDVINKGVIMIVGVGALGCEIAKDFALMGIGKLILVDLDTIHIVANLFFYIFPELSKIKSLTELLNLLKKTADSKKPGEFILGLKILMQRDQKKVSDFLFNRKEMPSLIPYKIIFNKVPKPLIFKSPFDNM